MKPQIILLLHLLAFSSIEAAYSRYNPQTDINGTVRELLVSFEDLKHEVRNHETEIRTFEEKTRNFEEMLDSLRQEQSDSNQAMRESLKNLSSGVDAKISNQESLAKGLTSSLQTHASDAVTALTEYKKRIMDLEKSVEIQNRNIENLQAALKSLIEASFAKEGGKITTDDSNRIYRVKAGDNLERIARQHQTSIKKIKELNNLTSDQIIIGQKIKIPDE